MTIAAVAYERRARSSFDIVAARLAASSTTLTERELLQPTHWAHGEDARLREDLRFRETPWGRWMLAEEILANDAVHRWLHSERRGSMPLSDALARAASTFGRRAVFCPTDPRFVLRQETIHLAAGELSDQPVVEKEVGNLEKYTTHLPLHSLKAAAASEPLGQWGPRAQEEAIETLGWVRVALPGARLNDRMFVAAVEGHSMDDGRSGLVDGGYAVFELWPAGSRQNLSVLVRGAFRDPETGSYAVKKYVADERDAEGRHQGISLVSLHPDKERFPDIALKVADDETVTVVAKVVRALSPEDYERRPIVKRRPGARLLDGQEGLDTQAIRLGNRLAAFFEDAVVNDPEDEDATLAASGWQTRLVCLDLVSGGPQLEVGPLAGLPSFVKKLRAVGGEAWDGLVLAVNARQRPVCLPVRPGTGPWRWEAVGFEDEEDLGLDKLALEALSPETPALFKVDVEGVGRQVTGTTLMQGQRYRLLLPPNVGDAALGTSLDNGPGGGWRLWELDLAAPPEAAVRVALTSLGLTVGEARPRLEWALAPAAAWRSNARGASYPVFEAESELFVHVGGLSLEEGEQAVLFLHGPSGTERLGLTEGGLVSLGTPATGRWACALLQSSTSIPAETLVFEVADQAIGHVPATWTADLPEGTSQLAVTAPPGWRVEVRWRVLKEESLARLYADEDGEVDLEAVHPKLEERSQRHRVADLIVDFGELGRRTFAYDRRVPVEQVVSSLTALWKQRSELVKSQRGAWMTLVPHWFRPVTALLGYDLEPDAIVFGDSALDVPHGLAAWRLSIHERFMKSVQPAPARVLVLTTNLDGAISECRAWMDDACAVGGVRSAIVTDGVRWTTHTKGDRLLRRQEWNVGHAIGLGGIDQMIHALAEGL